MALDVPACGKNRLSVSHAALDVPACGKNRLSVSHAALDVPAYGKTLYIVWDHHTWLWMFWGVMIQSARVGLSVGAAHGVGCSGV
ncbi:hypothetical protein L3X38_042200 [Prunus dulcis]|uniref:Uncharacterized protein n=1 Tax=Prunus dulcis TaxID=3755 RepID=A0AAD4YL02_PRUDU|nr:hypothetical protein L3X38_042200 [Prunus dulcis]